MGRTDISDALKRLDSLTQEEARMAAAQLLKVTNTIDNGVREVADNVLVVDRVASVDDRVKDVDDRVKAVDDKIAKVGDRVAGVGDRVMEAKNSVKAVDDKLTTVID